MSDQLSGAAGKSRHVSAVLSPSLEGLRSPDSLGAFVAELSELVVVVEVEVEFEVPVGVLCG